MLQMYPANGTKRTKQEYANLIRHCGWGVPSLEQALWSAGNSLSLVVEGKIPHYKKDGSVIKSRDMNFHSFLRPKDQLEALQNTQIEMRVTLSYLDSNPIPLPVEIRPSTTTHLIAYALLSRRPLETVEDFQSRATPARDP